jgi:cell division protein ZipA
MSELRWILIGFGIVLLTAIYLWGRRGNQAVVSDDAMLRARPEPAVHPGESPQMRAASDDEPHDELVPEPLAPTSTDEWNRREARREWTPPPVQAIDEPANERASAVAYDTWRGRVEPTFADAPTEELPVRPEGAPAAPTLSSSEAPQSRRVERRKILSLRLAIAPQRLEGAKLLETLLAESLEHGKYNIFHRSHADGSAVFSVASIVEPGTFDLEKMPETLYAGLTLFMQLPGPVPGMHALNELVACARRLQQNLGGTLQDERGVPLTVHRIERMRQEVREFERPPAGGRGAGSQSAHL